MEKKRANRRFSERATVSTTVEVLKNKGSKVGNRKDTESVKGVVQSLEAHSAIVDFGPFGTFKVSTEQLTAIHNETHSHKQHEEVVDLQSSSDSSSDSDSEPGTGMAVEMVKTGLGVEDAQGQCVLEYSNKRNRMTQDQGRESQSGRVDHEVVDEEAKKPNKKIKTKRNKERYLDKDGKVVVTADGVTWREIANDPIKIRENCIRRKASLMWLPHQGKDRSALEYFSHFFLTRRFINNMIDLINLRLQEKKQKALDGENEFYRFLGLLLAHRVFCNFSREEMFQPLSQDGLAATIEADALLFNPNLCEFMSLSRFNCILGSVCFAQDDDDSCESGTCEDGAESDVEPILCAEETCEKDDNVKDYPSWKSAQPLIDSFNARRLEAFDPSWKVFCGQRKRGDQRHADGSEYVSKQKRKPKGVDPEIRYLADVETGILCRLDLVENQPVQEFDNEDDNDCAALLRLCKPFKMIGGIVIADSVFASYTAAVQMKAKLGLDLFGMVETAHKYFPRSYLLNQHEYDDNAGYGSSLTLETTSKEGVTVYAIGLNDKRTKTIVTTVGFEEEPQQEKQCKKSQIVYKEVPRPAQVAEYFDSAQMIAFHKRRRQGNEALEGHVKANNWRARLFSTIVGMCFVDAFLAYKHFNNSKETQNMFLRALTSQLLQNGYPKANRDEEVTGERRVVGIAPGYSREGVNHTFESLGEHLAFATAKKKHKRCNAPSCAKHANMYCVSCSAGAGDNRRKVVAFCKEHRNAHTMEFILSLQ